MESQNCSTTQRSARFSPETQKSGAVSDTFGARADGEETSMCEVSQPNNENSVGHEVQFSVRDKSREDMDEKRINAILSRRVRRSKVIVREAPEFTQRLSNFTEASIGETVTIVGRFRAWPLATVTWYRDNNAIGETVCHVIETTNDGAEGVAKLTIKDVDRRDEGAYRCKVENDEGCATTTGYISVSGKSAKSSSDRSRSRSPSSRLSASPSRRADRSCTPSGLRAIVEQKSMEEHEEEESLRLGPSPIQDFIDDVTQKRSGLTKKAPPLVFCPAEIYIYPEDADSFEHNDSSGENDRLSASDEDKSTSSASSVPPPPSLVPNTLYPEEYTSLDTHQKCAKNRQTIRADNSSVSENPPKNDCRQSLEGITSDDACYSSACLLSGTSSSPSETTCAISLTALGPDQTSPSPPGSANVPEWSKSGLNLNDSDYDSGDSPNLEPGCERAPEIGSCSSMAYSSSPTDDESREVFNDETRYCAFTKSSKLDRLIVPERKSQNKDKEATARTSSNKNAGVVDRPGVSLQERRLRMFSKTMHRSSSESKKNQITTIDKIVPPLKPLTVTISATSSHPHPDDSDTSGVVLSSSENPSKSLLTPCGMDDLVTDADHSLTQPSQQPDIYLKNYEKNQDEDLLHSEKKCRLEDSKNEFEDKHCTIRIASRAVTRNTCGIQRSKSFDIRLHTGVKHPTKAIKSHQTNANIFECKTPVHQYVCYGSEISSLAMEGDSCMVSHSSHQTSNVKDAPGKDDRMLDNEGGIQDMGHKSGIREVFEQEDSTTPSNQYSSGIGDTVNEAILQDGTRASTNSAQDPVLVYKCAKPSNSNIEEEPNSFDGSEDIDSEEVKSNISRTFNENISSPSKRKPISFFVEDVSLKYQVAVSSNVPSPSEDGSPSILHPLEPLSDSSALTAVGNPAKLKDLAKQRIPVDYPLSTGASSASSGNNSVDMVKSNEISSHELVDRLFESLSQVRVQFYVLFVSIAAALAAAVAASSASTLLAVCCPVLVVLGGVKVVLITEAFRYVTSLLPLRRLNRLT